LQAVKIAFNGSRKLRTIKSKRRVCLICNDANNTNLELFIANEYLTPPVVGFAGVANHSQKKQDQDAVSYTFVINGDITQEQKRQTQNIVCVTDAVDPVIAGGGGDARPPQYRRLPPKKLKPKVYISAGAESTQQTQHDEGVLIYSFGAKSFTRQYSNHNYNKGMAGVFGKAITGQKNTVKAKGYIKTAEDEILEILQLLSA